MSYNKQSLNIISTSLVAQTVKRLPMIWEPQARSLGWEDPLEKEMATHSHTLAWKIPGNAWMEECGRLQSMGSKRVGQDWATSLSLSFSLFTFLEPTINLTPVKWIFLFLPFIRRDSRGRVRWFFWHGTPIPMIAGIWVIQWRVL